MSAPSSGEFYRPLTLELCQGDIFGLVPLVRLREYPQVVNWSTITPTRSGFEVEADFDPSKAYANRANRTVVTSCDFTFGMLLTHDCEIDKPATKDLTLAIIRPFDATVLQDPASADRIRQNEKYPLFYLPPKDEWAECYVDFRRVVSISTKVIKSHFPPKLRLSPDARDGMLYQFFRFLSRREVNAGSTTPTEPG